MTTLRELLTGSFRLLNAVDVNETPSADDLTIAVKAFNGMLDSWSNERLNIVSIDPYYFPLVPGKQNYTLGPGADWDIPRPMNIQQATLGIGQEFVQTYLPVQPAPIPHIGWTTNIFDNTTPAAVGLSGVAPLTGGVSIGVVQYTTGVVLWNLTWTPLSNTSGFYSPGFYSPSPGVGIIIINDSVGLLTVSATVDGVLSPNVLTIVSTAGHGTGYFYDGTGPYAWDPYGGPYGYGGYVDTGYPNAGYEYYGTFQNSSITWSTT